MKKLIFTICSNNYLAQAITLGNSIMEFNSDYLFRIGLVDKPNNQIKYSELGFDIIEVERIGISEFSEMFDRYNVTELNTAVKPFYFQYFLRSMPEIESIIYLDPDILVYGPFLEIDKEFEKSNIILTPHITSPLNDNKFQSENDFLNSGLYNLGFLGIKSCEDTERFLNWWSERLVNKAHIDFTNGMFTDQLWINFVPLFFSNVKVLTHPGYNMAYWNLHERSVSKTNEVYYVNSSFPLVFFHFSGYDPLKPEILSKYQNRYTFEIRKDVLPLFSRYSELLFNNSYQHYKKFTCSYVETKEKLYEQKMLAKIKKISIFKRAARKIILKIIKRFGIVLDYKTLS